MNIKRFVKAIITLFSSVVIFHLVTIPMLKTWWMIYYISRFINVGRLGVFGTFMFIQAIFSIILLALLNYLVWIKQ